MITCQCCNIEKIDTDFYKNKNRKSGRSAWCIKCKKDYDRVNKLRIDETRKQYKDRHKEKLKIFRTEYLLKNKIRISVKKREYYDNHKTEILLRSTHNLMIRRKHDPYFNFTYNLRGRIREGFKYYSKNGKTLACKEYGIDFKEIYDKVGPRPSKEYHLDHIIPLCLFNLDNAEHVKMANCAENLRWILANENLSKNKKLDISLINENNKLLKIYNKLNVDNLSLTNKSNEPIINR